MIFVKVCGLTNVDDAQAALDAGADALGFVFWQRSPRAVHPKEIASWLPGLPGPAKKVGVFVNSPLNKIIEIVERCGLNAIQLHGDETVKDLGDLKKILSAPIIRAYRPKQGEDVSQWIDAGVDMLLLDRVEPGIYGGTGEKSDWQLARELTRLPVPIILSGGLSPENVREACEKVKPYGVDASSSLEKKPGIKDHARIKEFVTNAKS